MGFFNLYKPKEYGYRYIYYDPKKEAKAEREKELLSEKEKSEGEFKTSIKRGTFRALSNRNNQDRHIQTRNSNVRLIIIVIILLAIAYYLLT